MARGVLQMYSMAVCDPDVSTERRHAAGSLDRYQRSIVDMESLDSPTYPGTVALPDEIVVACG